MYPENTLLSFEKAAGIKGLTGIELDIQLTRDGHMVVCHDERVDRTTDGIGALRGFTLRELKKLKIRSENGRWEQIPTIDEVFDLLEDPLKNTDLKLNIELKNSVYPYEGMEEAIVALVHKRGLESSVIYSSFYALSLKRLRELEPAAELGILDGKVSDCLFKQKGGCGANALHPYWQSIDLTRETLAGFAVRAWFAGHLYPDKPTGTRLDLRALEKKGITDVIINEPEAYL